MENIFNCDLIKMLLSRIDGIKVQDEGNRLIVSHNGKDWDMITILSQRLMLVAERWMENQEPRTTIYKG